LRRYIVGGMQIEKRTIAIAAAGVIAVGAKP
jgi:hypothetical protein